MANIDMAHVMQPHVMQPGSLGLGPVWATLRGSVTRARRSGSRPRWSPLAEGRDSANQMSTKLALGSGTPLRLLLSAPMSAPSF